MVEKNKKVTEGCPQGSELRSVSDRCFLKSKIVPEPLGRLANVVWASSASGSHRLSRTAFGVPVLIPLNQNIRLRPSLDLIWLVGFVQSHNYYQPLDMNR